MPANTIPIAANPNNPNELLVGAEDYNCPSFQGFYSTSDAGATWTHTCLPVQTGTDGGYDPIVGYDLNNVAYAGGLQAPAADANYASRVVISSSTDNGQTWGTPVTAIGFPLGYAADTPWLAVDDSPTSSRKNTLYVASTQWDKTFTETQIWVSHSTDGGQQWTPEAVDTLQITPEEDLFDQLTVGADGTVYLVWLRCSRTGVSGDCAGVPANIFLSKSADGGSTWSAAVTVAQVTLAPDPKGCCFFGELPHTLEEVTNIPVTAVVGTGSSAKVYVAFYSWSGSQMQVEVATSTNGGSTFGSPVRVSSTNTGDEFYPWITSSSSGNVVVTWLDRRNDPNNVKYQPFIAQSRDGLSFSTNRTLSGFLSDPANDGLGGQFMGFYRTHVIAGQTLFSAWMDTRTGSCQAEVGGVQF